MVLERISTRTEGRYRGREVSDRQGDNKGILVLVCIEVNMQQGGDMQLSQARPFSQRLYKSFLFCGDKNAIMRNEMCKDIKRRQNFFTKAVKVKAKV